MKIIFSDYAKKYLSVFFIVALFFMTINIGNIEDARAAGFDLSSLAPFPFFDVDGQDADPRAIAFNNDGTKMFVTGLAGDNVYEYTLSIAYNHGSATYVDSYDISDQDGSPTGLAFNTDGTKMFISNAGGDQISEYTLTTGFDVSTASYVDSKVINTEDTAPQGVTFNTDGTKMFVPGGTGEDINEYTLETGFDVSTASFVDSFDVSAQDDIPNEVAFNTDGTKMFVLGDEENDVFEYTLTTGFDISTASYDEDNYGIAYVTIPEGFFFNTDGTEMFVLEDNGDIHKYSLSTGFDITTADLYDSFSVNSQESAPEEIDFNTDGTKMFVVGSDGDDVNEYTLSTAFDVSSASFVDSFSVSGQDTLPTGIAFNTDGTKMFVSGDAGNDINEYTLETGFDVSTAEFAEYSFSVSGQDTIPEDVAFNTDGTKMFVLGGGADDVFEYTLETGFDLSTASYDGDNSYDVSSEEEGASGLAFNADGTKMFVSGYYGDDVNEYTLTTGFDLSTAGDEPTDNFSVSRQVSTPVGVALSADDTKMFIICTSGNRIYQYSTNNTAPIVGHTSNNVLGAPTQDADGTGNVNIPFRVQDADTDNNTTKEWQYSDDGGSTWNDLEAGDMTGEDGNKSSATDWSGTEHTIVWGSQNDIDDTDQDDIQFAFKVNDGTVDSTARATSTSFSVDNLDPSVSTYFPTDNATGVTTTANLILTFDEAVDTESGNLVIYKTSDDSVVETIDITDTDIISGTGSTSITINPSSDLAYETEYYVKIGTTNFDDDKGNSYAGITDTTTWSFTTEDTPPCTAIDNAATYNAYPTCGVATCNDGYTLSDGACNSSGGSAPLSPSSIGTGQADSSIPMYKSKAVGKIKSRGTNLLMYIESNAKFSAITSQTMQIQNHNLKILDLNMTTKKITLQISSEPKIVKLQIDEKKDIDLDGDGINDISLAYNNLLINRIDLTVKQIEFNQTNGNTQINFDPGSLVKEFNHYTVYLIQDNKKRPFFNEAAFVTNNYDWIDIQEIADLSYLPTGEMIYAVLDKKEDLTQESDKYIFKYNLFVGTIAKDVKKLQQYLNRNGFLLTNSGPGSIGQETEFFGRLTKQALINFQKINNISPAFGYFGPITRGVVNN